MKTVHFLGIAGSGASAVAAIAESSGFKVTGCDLNPDNEFTSKFKAGQLTTGHNPKHLSGVDILVITPAILSLDPNNQELLHARKMQIPVLTWQQFMGKYLEQDKFVIAICGTHGKSTTTAMIGLMLENAGLDPTVELGAIVPSWKSNYRISNSKAKVYFVTEADEFNDNFLATYPDIAVVTNIEMDHPEYFKDFSSYKASFAKFLASTKQLIIANLADPGVADTIALLSDPNSKPKAKLVDYSSEFLGFALKIPGYYNVLNAKAAYQVGLAINLDPQVIKSSLSSYQGIGRRFELLGERQNVKIYSDFGHHPTEVKLTLEAARQQFPDQKIIAIFQPHMFSRTFALLPEFMQVLKNLPVNKTYVLDIYPSREIDKGLISSQKLVQSVDRQNVEYVKNPQALFAKLDQDITPESIFFFIGAGDSDKWAREYLQR